MEAEVNLEEATVEVGAVRRVFTRMTPAGGYSWDISFDGQRVLVGVPVETPAEPFTLIQNWMAVQRK
ncbi:MAG TPA: hypothetical protein VMG40_06960 [Bryobacteraceae bacterium]|nr:hypothetical protein [Bryobacteraceae bacterium]